MPEPHENIKIDPLVGKTLGGRYLIQELLDRGGMGKVFRAEQQPLGRPVALKTLDLYDPTGEFQQRFFNEAAVASKLSHPNTVRIFDYGRSDDGTYFLTMELLQGQSLQNVLKQEGAIDWERVVSLGRQVSGALHEAHQHGIVHRDLKPGNIFLTRHEEDLEFAKVLDFGLVKNLEVQDNLSHTGQTLGSPLYMSPEQVEGEDLDRRADIYSLGLVMYVALSGKVPFKRGNVATVLFQQVTAKIPSFATVSPDLDIPECLEWIVRRCVEKDRTKRFATMREVSLALKLANQQLRGEVPPLDWRLDSAGLLILPDELSSPELTEMSMPDLVGPEPERSGQGLPVMDITELESAPSLDRSNASLVAGAAAVGMGGFGVVLMIVLLLVVLGGGGAALWYVNSPPVAQIPIERVPAPVPQPLVEPRTPNIQVVTVTSEPPGADVIKGGSLIGTTPLEVRVVMDDQTRVEVELQSAGHISRTLLLDGTVPTVNVTLKPEPGPTVNPTPQPTKPPPAEPTPKPPSKPVPVKVNDGVRDPWAD